MRDSIVFFLNGQRVTATGNDAFLSLSDFLRYRKQLTGTKVVCAEGDCGACTVLYSRLQGTVPSAQGTVPSPFFSINSCISFVFQMDGCHLVTVEGLQQKERLHCAQKSMIENFGAQCGFCTPGIIGSMAYLTEESKQQGFAITEKKARNYLTGNLCRCTGYQPILDACVKMDTQGEARLSDRYLSREQQRELAELLSRSVCISSNGKTLFLPATLPEALALRDEKPGLRIVSGATDLGVWINKGKYAWTEVMSLQNIGALSKIEDRGPSFWIGARASLAQIESALTRAFPEFGNLLHIFASPQIKNSATLVGNLLNASPIGDTLPFLMAADAMICAESAKGSRRKILMKDFYGGYKQVALQPDEIVTGVEIPKSSASACLYKTSVRKDLDISSVTFASVFQLDGNLLADVRIAVGGVGPIVIRVKEVEDFLSGKPWTKDHFLKAAQILRSKIAPLSDVRGSREYRLKVAGNLLMKMYFEKGQGHGLVPKGEEPPWL